MRLASVLLILNLVTIIHTLSPEFKSPNTGSLNLANGASISLGCVLCTDLVATRLVEFNSERKVPLPSPDPLKQDD